VSIDRLGRTPAAAPPTSGEAPLRPAEADRTFEATRGSPPTEIARGPAASEVTASSALERLRLGQIDLHGYVDLKVKEATSHLSLLPQVDLDAIRSAMRDRLLSDPTLVGLVHTATGAMPKPDDND
jgi:hypothetical protein